MKSVQLFIDRINNIIQYCEYTEKKIKVERITTKDIVLEHMNHLWKYLPFLPKDLMTYSSKDIFASLEAKGFLKKLFYYR